MHDVKNLPQQVIQLEKYIQFEMRYCIYGPEIAFVYVNLVIHLERADLFMKFS